ncbi:tetratricopeptide repeat protein [Nocardia sp. NPDC024068]|uniref:tetratricopeptide repeat protein n=1 Tax=Nocardia sp. NPDC024068 TaxID=3157197 RepID=UPI0034013467
MREMPRVPGVLGGLSVVASALLLELGRNLVMNSFGEGSEVQVLASGLRWLAVLVIALALLYTGYRVIADRRSGVRRAYRRSLLDGLDGPPPSDSPAVAREPEPAPGGHAADGNAVAAALRELPVFDYDAATVHAILTAMGMEQVPAAQPVPPVAPAPALVEPWTAAGLLANLVRGEVLECYERQRYRIVRAPWEPARAIVLAGALWQAALFALVSHTADRAAGWAAGMTTAVLAPRARRWFAVEEKWLREIVANCCNDALVVAAVPPATAVQLVRIGDALDVWYALGGDGVDEESGVDGDGGAEEDGGEKHTRTVARELMKLGPVKLGGHYTAMRLRAKVLEGAVPRRWPPWWRTTGIGARAEHANGLTLLETATSPPEVSKAVERLREAWWRLPREDAASQVRVLTALAVAYIRLGRVDAAQDRLELAALRARDDEDGDGWARAQELTAAVYWSRGEPRAALRCWLRALTTYRDLADDRGIGRTLQHLGGAALKVPEHADLLLVGDGAPGEAEVYWCAHGWLAEALRRNPDAAYAQDYHADAAELRGGADAPAMDRWPPEARDPAEPDRG